jgi:mono/diheme cytochrome c family protein
MVKRMATLAVACLGWVSSQAYANDEVALGKKVYTTCAACHLPTGDGVPGAFPPLTNKHYVATLEGGKNYLISVVLQGLSGPITVEGTAYYGFMQAFSPSLSNEEIAAVLNYVTSEISIQTDTPLSPFSADEVATVRQQIATGTWPKSSEIRKTLALP